MKYLTRDCLRKIILKERLMDGNERGRQINIEKRRKKERNEDMKMQRERERERVVEKNSV